MPANPDAIARALPKRITSFFGNARAGAHRSHDLKVINYVICSGIHFHLPDFRGKIPRPRKLEFPFLPYSVKDVKTPWNLMQLQRTISCACVDNNIIIIILLHEKSIIKSEQKSCDSLFRRPREGSLFSSSSSLLEAKGHNCLIGEVVETKRVRILDENGL